MRVKLSRLILLSMVVVASGVVQAAAAEPQYAIVDLGTLPGGSYGAAYAINELGQVVGASDTAEGEEHAFLWQDGVMMDLGTLGGRESVALDVNLLGQVVGYSENEMRSLVVHAFLWQDGTMIDLGTLIVGGETTVATAINARGQVVGSSDIEPEVIRTTPGAFLWQDGTMIALGTLGGSASSAFDINNQGQVVGSSQIASGPFHAFLWQDGVMIDLGTLPGDAYSAASGINERGQVVGWSADASLVQRRPFLWENGTMTALPARSSDSVPIAINERGQVVGTENLGRATLWEGGLLTYLSHLDGFYGGRATDINARGQSVGVNWNSDSIRAVLWSR